MTDVGAVRPSGNVKTLEQLTHEVTQDGPKRHEFPSVQHRILPCFPLLPHSPPQNETPPHSKAPIETPAALATRWDA